MPQVPLYNDRAVGPAQLPGARVKAPTMRPTEGAAGQLAEGATRLGRGMQDIAAQRARSANEARITEATNGLMKSATELRIEASERHGRNALELPDDKSLGEFYGDKLQERIDEITQGLSNPFQKERFAEVAAGVSRGLNRSLARHVSAEQDAYEKAQTQATIDTAKSRAVLLRSDPEVMQQSTDAVIASVRRQLMDAGTWGDKDIRQSAMTGALSSMYRDAIIGLIDGNNLSLANQYMKQYGQHMDGRDTTRVRSTYHQAQQVYQSQSWTDRLWAQSGGDYFAAVEAAREQLGGEMQDSVVTRLHNRYVQDRAQKKAYHEGMFDRAVEQAKAGNPIDPSALSELDPDERGFVQKIKFGWNTHVTHMNKWLEYMNLSTQQRADLSSSEYLTQYGQYFDRADVRRGNKMRLASIADVQGKAADAGNDKDAFEGRQIFSEEEVIGNAVTRAGLDGDDQQEAAYQFRRKIQKRIELWEDHNKKKATIDDMQGIVDDMIANTVFVSEWGTDPELPLGTLDKDQLANAYVVVDEQNVALASIPREYRMSAIRRIRDRGMEPSAELVARMWLSDNPESATEPEPRPTPDEARRNLERGGVGVLGRDDDLGQPGGQYRTELDADTEQQYESWVNSHRDRLGNDPTADYDLRGWFKANAKDAGDHPGHFTDKYKKPNHMTFSQGSIYSNAEHLGGRWAQLDDGAWVFYASPFNLKMHSRDEMKRYFDRVESDSVLVFPDGERYEPGSR